MGFGSSGAAGAGADMLQEILRERATEAFRNQELKLRQDALRQQGEIQRAQLERQSANDAYLREQRDALSDLRRQQQADRLAGTLAPGAALDPTAMATLQTGGLSSLVQHRDATLPSRNISGVLDAAADGVKSASRPLRIVNMMSTPNPGKPAADLYLGTGAQQQAQQLRERVQALINDPDTPDNVRQYLTIQSAGNKGSLPNALFVDPDEKAARDLELYKDKRDYAVSHPLPSRAAARVPLRLAPGQDDPAFPRGVQTYVSQIATKHPNDYQAALSELSQYISTQQDHPALSADKAIRALKTAMGRPVGVRSSPGGGPGLPTVVLSPQARNAGSGQTPAAAVKAAPGSSVSEAAARAFLQTHGQLITPANIQATREYLERGGK